MGFKVALLVLVSFLLHVAPPAYSERRGFRASMTRTEKPINFTRAARQSLDRLSMLASRARLDATTATETPLRSDGGAYEMELAIGTPPQTLTALADTGSDLIWAKCGACESCQPKGSPSYFPDRSSTFSKLPCSGRLCQALPQSTQPQQCAAAECDYRYSYGLDGDPHHYTQGYLAGETITLGGDAAPGVAFGCTNMSEGGFGKGSGLVGLGRGQLSLVSQLDVGAFSYCLTPDTTKASPLLFGSLATLSGDGVQSTPLLPDTTFYSVQLESISIGAATTPGPSTRGVVFDSGTTLTYLADPAYTSARTALLSQTTSLTREAARQGLETCFGVDPSGNGTVDVPEMVLHFDGGADMALPLANYFVEVEKGVLCWVVLRSPSDISIVGNIMQMNYHIRHDVDKSILSFQPANCDTT